MYCKAWNQSACVEQEQLHIIFKNIVFFQNGQWKFQCIWITQYAKFKQSLRQSRNINEWKLNRTDDIAKHDANNAVTVKNKSLTNAKWTPLDGAESTQVWAVCNNIYNKTSALNPSLHFNGYLLNVKSLQACWKFTVFHSQRRHSWSSGIPMVKMWFPIHYFILLAMGYEWEIRPSVLTSSHSVKSTLCH